MLSVLESSIVLSLMTKALVLPSITALLLDLTISRISMADAHLLNGASNSNTANLTVSEEERRRYLDQLQSETTRIMIPAMVFLIILAVVGLVGNCLVTFIYFCRLKLSATRILISAIAIFDLVANVIAIPGDIYDMFHIWDFNNPPLCRARFFFSAFSTLSSGMTLAAVAVTRFRKVCRPHQWQITIHNAKVISIGICCFGALISIPYAVLSGRQTKQTPRSDIIAYECTVDDAYIDTIYPFINYVFFLFLYFFCCGFITVLYFLIGVKAWKHSKMHGSNACTPRATFQNATSSRHTSQQSVANGDRNESNCTSRGIALKRNVDTSITDDSTIHSTDRVGDNKMQVFHVGNEDSKALIQYNIRVFTDRVEIRTPLIGEFFVQLQKTHSFSVDLPGYDNSECNNTDNGKHFQHSNCSGEDTANGGIRIMESNISDEVMRTVKSNPENIDSNEKYTKRSLDEIPNECEPLSIFRWLDVIYCPDDGHAILDSNCVQRESSLSYRLALSDNLLQKTEWLRNSISEVITRQDQMEEDHTVKDSCVDSVPVQIPAVDTTLGPCNSPEIPCDSGLNETIFSELHTHFTGVRLQEFLSKRFPSAGTASPRHKIKKRSIGRITVMLCIISVIYILGYLPHLGLMFVKFLSPGMLENMSTVDRKLYNLFLRTFFLNCAVNPIVYSFCDDNFRRECFKFLKCS